MAINPLDIRKKTNQPQTGGLNTQGKTTEQVRQQASTLNKSKVVQNQNIQPSTVQTSDLKQSGVTPQVGETGTQLLRRTALDVAQREKRRGGMRLPTNTVEAKTDEEALMVAEQKAKEKASMVEAQKSVFSEIPKTEEATPEQPPLSESERLIEEKQAIQDKLASQYDEIEGRQVSMSEIAKEQQFAQKTAQKQMRDIEVQEREIADVERRKAQTKDAEEASLLEFQKQEKLAGVQNLMGSDPEMSYTAASIRWDNQQKLKAQEFLNKPEAIDLFNEFLTSNPEAEQFDIFSEAARVSGGNLDDAEKLFSSRYNKDIGANMRDDYLINVKGVDPATVKADRAILQTRDTENFIKTGGTNDGGLTASNYVKQLMSLDNTGRAAAGKINQLLADQNLNASDRDILSLQLGDIQKQMIADEEKATGDISERFMSGQLSEEEEKDYLDRTRKLQIAKKGQTVGSGIGAVTVQGGGAIYNTPIPDKFPDDIEDIINSRVDGSLTTSEFSSSLKGLPQNTIRQVMAAVGKRTKEREQSGEGNMEAMDVAQSIFDGTSNMTIKDISVSGGRREKVGLELQKLKNNAVKSGDIMGVIRSSAGGTPMSDTQKQQFAKGLSVISQIGAIKAEISELDTGPIKGIFMSKNPYDVKAGLLKAQLTSLIPNLARGVYGEVGVLTDNDVALYQKTVPNLTSKEDLNKALLSMTVRAVQRGLENQINVNAAAGTDMSGFAPIYEDLKAQSDSLLGMPSAAQQAKAQETMTGVKETFGGIASGIKNLFTKPQPKQEVKQITAETPDDELEALFNEDTTQNQTVTDEDINNIWG